MNARGRATALGVCLGACLGGCQEKRASEPAAPVSVPASPDRLGPGERLPEAETAFGLALPSGMRLVRHFDDAAYFAGDVELDALIAHVEQRVQAGPAQVSSQGVSFPRARVLGGDSRRLLRLELTRTPRGTQLHVKDITPPPALTGLSEEELWRMAGRNLDGTMVDEDQIY